MNPSIKGAPELTLCQSAGGDPDEVYARIAKRIIPCLVLLFLTAWLDRYNLGFAKLRMLKDLGFSEAVYGFGAGIVYAGYALFEVPSNLLLERIGARKTFARITILWGITSVAMILVRTPIQFYILRFLLGCFEAGLLPGVLVYLTYWFPARRGAQMVSLFSASIPIATILGGPISGWIMDSMGGRVGLANWQWLFLLEGIPSIILGMLALRVIVDRPAEAGWLSDDEKRLVLADLEMDHRAAGPREHGLALALKQRKLWLLTAIRFCGISSNVTIGFWVPAIIRSFGVKSAFNIGILSTAPYIFALVAMVVVGRHSDRTLERRYHSALPYLASGLGLIGIGVFAGSPVPAFGCLILAAAGPLVSTAVFWQIPTSWLAGTAAAGGIALINSVASLSGWVGPSLVGWLEDATGKTTTGLYIVAGLEILATVLTLLFVPRSVRGRVTAQT